MEAINEITISLIIFAIAQKVHTYIYIDRFNHLLISSYMKIDIRTRVISDLYRINNHYP